MRCIRFFTGLTNLQGMKIRIRNLPFLLIIFSFQKVFSQAGGPPMLTTDPGTPGKNHWEINTSMNFNSSSVTSIEIPTTEIVYGMGKRSQISVQLPMTEIELNQRHFTQYSQPQMGVKYELIDEEKHFLSFAVYPQIIVPIAKGQKLQCFIPLEFEKTFQNFRVGEEIGYFVLNNPHTLFNGTVAGYRFPNNVELMGEFFFTTQTNQVNSISGLLNFGFRKELNEHFVLMSSIGTQIITPEQEDKQHLFGLVGVQILLGK